MIFQTTILLLLQITISSPTPTVVATEPSSSKLLPLITSIIALTISLITLGFSSYNQYFKKPKVRILIADQMETWLTHNNELVLNVSVAIFNDGAQYGAISRIIGRIKSDHFLEAAPFRWKMFIEHKNVSEVGKNFKPFGAFAGWAYTLVIPSRQAVAKTVQFVTDEPVVLQPGIYTFEFAGFLGDIAVPKAKASITIDLNQDQVSMFGETRADKDTMVAQKAVRLRRRLPTEQW
jgi:hypothetical protein